MRNARVPWTAASLLLALPLAGGDGPLLDPGSDPTAVLFGVFVREGWSGPDAVAITERAVQRLKGERVGAFTAKEPTDPEVKVCMHPDSSPSAVLFAEFCQTGWDPLDAATQTVSMLAALAPDGEGADAAIQGPECYRVPITLVICDGESTRRQLVWASGAVWEAMEVQQDGADAPPPPEGMHRWRLVSLDNEGLGCAWASDLGAEGLWVPCSWSALKPTALSPLGETVDRSEPACCDPAGDCAFIDD